MNKRRAANPFGLFFDPTPTLAEPAIRTKLGNETFPLTPKSIAAHLTLDRILCRDIDSDQPHAVLSERQPLAKEQCVKTKLLLASIVTLAILSAIPLLAHHGTGISYDLQKNPITLKGTVTEFRWKNPHVSIFLDVKDETGKVTNWSIECTSIISYAQKGYNKNSLKVGQEVTALLYPSKVKGAPAGVLAKITLPDGKEILRYQGDTPGSRVFD
jgi:Family of unknown function (DUF6152)